jgi:hypothetical protein
MQLGQYARKGSRSGSRASAASPARLVVAVSRQLLVVVIFGLFHRVRFA